MRVDPAAQGQFISGPLPAWFSRDSLVDVRQGMLASSGLDFPRSGFSPLGARTSESS
jgi:hypothetical protein